MKINNYLKLIENTDDGDFIPSPAITPALEKPASPWPVESIREAIANGCTIKLTEKTNRRVKTTIRKPQ